jgi:2-oxoglutarate dehydrogenase E1 component
MTPKSLLRLPAASSELSELTEGGFQPVIDDASIKSPEKISRIVLCSGKVFYDIDAARQAAATETIALVRLEQFYPFPKAALAETFARYSNASELVWAQEEPKNMGGWTFMEPRLRELAGSHLRLSYVGREPSASPATGSYVIHELEQKKLVEEALAIGEQSSRAKDAA